MQAQPIQESAAPLRGTQSLVGVMGYVWKHPSLTLLELGWRWCAALPLLWLGWRSLSEPWSAIPLHRDSLASMTFLEPVRSASVLTAQLRLYLPALLAMARWWVPLALLLWTVSATAGRSAILRRAAPALGAALGSMALANFLRASAFLLLLWFWALALGGAARNTITTPAARGGEPNVVLFTAEAVGATLLAFLVWSITVWRLDLRPIQAMADRRPETQGQRQELRSKLVETNLVMGIVRVALLVLAMTFSASPLPFQSEQTQAFITVWWVGVGLLYLVGSDFFHVVRRVTYLRLLQSIAVRTNALPSRAS